MVGVRVALRGGALVLGFALIVASDGAFAVTAGGAATSPAARRPGGDRLFRGTGFFRTARKGARWWIVSPEGQPFYVNGIDHVSATPDTDIQTGRCPYCDAIAAAYPDHDAWVAATIDRLQAWGFNTLGAWSDSDLWTTMPYTVLLDMAGGDDWFAPEFAVRAAAIAASDVAPRKDDPNLVGWYLDSELRWGPDWRKQTQLLDDYLALPPEAPGRKVAERYVGRPERFMQALATHYFRVTTAAIRAQDPNHMILGSKMITQLTPRVLLRAARHFIDVLTLDDYTLASGLDDLIQQTWGPFLPRTPDLRDFYRAARRPIMVAEYSFRAADADLPNTWPPIFPVYATQQDRADAYAAYVEQLHEAPWIVGDFWFEFTDEPPGGRFDHEDSNFGVVATSDIPWQILVDRMITVHAQAPSPPG